MVTGGKDGLMKTWRTTDWTQVDQVALAAPNTNRETIASVAISADGQHLALGGESGALMLCDLHNHGTRRLKLGTERVSRVSFAPERRVLLAAIEPTPFLGDLVELIVVDAESGQRKWSRPFDSTDSPRVVSYGWHRTGKWLAIGTLTAQVMVLDADNGETMFHHAFPRQEPYVRWCGFDPPGQLLLVGASPGVSVWEWNGTGATEIEVVAHPHRRPMTAAAFSPDGKLLAALMRDGSLNFIDTQTWKLLRTFDSPFFATYLQSLQWARQAPRIVAARNDSIDVWHTPPHPCLPQLFLHAGAIRSVDVHPDGRSILTAAEDGRVCSTDLETGHSSVLDVSKTVRSARFSPTGKRTLVFDGERILVCEAGIAAPLRNEPATCALFIDDDRVLVAQDRTTAILDVTTGKFVTLHEHGGPVLSAAVDLASGLVFTGGADRLVQCARTSTSGSSASAPIVVESNEKFKHGSPIDTVAGLGVAPKRGILLISCVNNPLWVCRYDQQGPRPGAKPMCIRDRFGGLVAIHPHEDVAVLADYSFGRITWLDLRTLDFDKMVMSDQHTQTVTAIRFTRSGKLCLTASLDGTVQIWDCATRTIRSTLRIDGTTINDACFTPDEQWFVTGDGRGEVKLWPVEPLATARQYAQDVARRRR